MLHDSNAIDTTTFKPPTLSPFTLPIMDLTPTQQQALSSEISRLLGKKVFNVRLEEGEHFIVWVDPTTFNDRLVHKVFEDASVLDALHDIYQIPVPLVLHVEPKMDAVGMPWTLLRRISGGTLIQADVQWTRSSGLEARDRNMPFESNNAVIPDKVFDHRDKRENEGFEFMKQGTKVSARASNARCLYLVAFPHNSSTGHRVAVTSIPTRSGFIELLMDKDTFEIPHTSLLQVHMSQLTKQGNILMYNIQLKYGGQTIPADKTSGDSAIIPETSTNLASNSMGGMTPPASPHPEIKDWDAVDFV
ncbi:hypothetical protein D9757_003213 [Collybiopsis confluens]|uniref:Uncharacterized protein n=1 Tax=Collybiopsis confluens TaxID=2823264 RepID=A0A8H5HZ73_9AGAR|nr:hypothetical protein D9757_003213 [Collybiopsis confluens]